MQSQLLVSSLSLDQWIESFGAMHLLATTSVFTIALIATIYTVSIVLNKTFTR